LSRKKSFDEQEILEEIGRIFWRNGYAATSMDLISDQVSLKKPSLYNAYGDKAALFRKVVNVYIENVLIDSGALLKGDASVSDEVGALFRYFHILPSADVVSRGCLLTTSLIELQYSEPKLFRHVRAQIDRIAEELEFYLSTAQNAGRISLDANPSILGQYLFTVLQGLRVQARTRAGQTNLDLVISTALEPIRTSETQLNQSDLQ